jgi:hypothetical protein
MLVNECLVIVSSLSASQTIFLSLFSAGCKLAMLHVGTRISAPGHIEELPCVRSAKNPSLYEV